jgi:hypothetical protein
MIVFVNNKSVLFRLFMCIVTLTRSPGKPGRNTSTKYLKRSRRAHIKYITPMPKILIATGYIPKKAAL